ncbi:unnamed protein product, partial [Scytosiphon promiscuus]
TVFYTSLKRFGVRRQKTSASYFLKTSIRGRQKFFTIGRHGLPWAPDTARRQAMALKADPQKGIEEKVERLTLNEIVERFKVNHYAKIKPRTRKDYTSLLDNQILPTLGKKDIKEISRTDIANFHQKYAHTPRRANMALAVISIIMSWAEEFGFRDSNSNPCKGIKKFSENKRER